MVWGVGPVIYCAAQGCASYTDSPTHFGWLFVLETTEFLDTKEQAFCCWKCLAHYAYDMRPVL